MLILYCKINGDSVFFIYFHKLIQYINIKIKEMHHYFVKKSLEINFIIHFLIADGKNTIRKFHNVIYYLY